MNNNNLKINKKLIKILQFIKKIILDSKTKRKGKKIPLIRYKILLIIHQILI
jgi:hypothetical protein